MTTTLTRRAFLHLAGVTAATAALRVKVVPVTRAKEGPAAAAPTARLHVKSGLDFTKEEIAEMATWPYFRGFTADSCGRCKKTANVLWGAGYFCPCGHYNILSWYYTQIPHEAPYYGPSRQVIAGALALELEPGPAAGDGGAPF